MARKKPWIAVLLTLVVCAGVATAQDHEGMSEEALAEAMAAAEKYTQPSEYHKFLEQFIGTWDTTMRFTMAGIDEMPPSKGTEVSYDNFKQSYVLSRVSTLDTAMHYAEGDLDPGGKALIMYGLLDEYTTGEHDKMVKTITRLISPDEIVLEVHDLPIGEHNTQVIEFTYTRVKAAGP